MKIQATELYEEIDQKVREGKRYIFLRGSSRSGKTVSSIQFLIVQALVNPKTTITIARETQVSIKNTIFVDFKEQMEKMGEWMDSLYNKVEMIYRFPNGSIIRFVGLDDSTGKLRGLKSSIVMVDEINTIPMSAFVQLDIRCEQYLIGCYNPEVSPDWFGFDYENKENGCVLVSTWRQNPFLDERIIQSIQSLKETDYDLWLIYSESQIVPPREIIYQKPVLIDQFPPQVKQKYYGLDFGFSNDACALVEVGAMDKNLYVREVVYQHGLTNEDLAFLIKENGINRNNDIVADSSEPKSIEELRRLGLNVRKVSDKGILFGIQKLRQYKIHVQKDSFNLISEFDNYRYKKDRSGRITNSTKGPDHALDALRYCVTEFLDTKKGKFVIV